MRSAAVAGLRPEPVGLLGGEDEGGALLYLLGASAARKLASGASEVYNVRQVL